MKEKIFISCNKCGKKLVERQSNGMFKFLFGARPGSDAVVDLTIQGNLKMKCIRRSCRAINIINALPFVEE